MELTKNLAASKNSVIYTDSENIFFFNTMRKEGIIPEIENPSKNHPNLGAKRRVNYVAFMHCQKAASLGTLKKTPLFPTYHKYTLKKKKKKNSTASEKLLGVGCKSGSVINS